MSEYYALILFVRYFIYVTIVIINYSRLNASRLWLLTDWFTVGNFQ
jgi:hypothetical protein